VTRVYVHELEVWEEVAYGRDHVVLYVMTLSPADEQRWLFECCSRRRVKRKVTEVAKGGCQRLQRYAEPQGFGTMWSVEVR
jgi:hypothetical protein